MDVISRGGPEVRRLLQLWDRLSVDNGLLKRRYESTDGQHSRKQLVVPSVLRNEILQALHAGALEGHLGEDKTIAKVQERFYWSELRHDVIQWLRTCPACVTRKSPPQKNRAPLQTVTSGRLLLLISLVRYRRAQLVICTFWWSVTILQSGLKPTLSPTKRQPPWLKNL